MGSIAAGAVLVTRPDPWWRGFGQQHVGWGVVDLAIVGLVQTVQRRQLQRLPDPYDPGVLERKLRRLRTVLLVNVVADVGYCVVGAILLRHHAPQVVGAGAAIVIQRAFLAIHDGYHARQIRWDGAEG